MQFDLLIRNGQLFDAAAGRVGRFDVAVYRGRVAAVEASIDPGTAAQVVDAAGAYVTPGLVDLHTHVYHGVTYWGIQAAPVAARTGVTTWLDVGSAGAWNFGGFRDFIVQPSVARIYALLNISGIGLIAPSWEHWNLNYLDEALAIKVAEANRDIIIGIKARIDKNTVGANGLEPLRRARRVADACGMPLMAHIAHGPPEVDGVLALLREGDILTHCCTGGSMRLIDADGRPLEVARRAREAGVILDIGHGAGSFDFEVAEAMLRHGMPPDVISSDIHQLSIRGPMFDLPTTLSKFLALGMPLAEVFAAATAKPAAAMGLAGQVGTLAVGAHADIALFREEQGDYNFDDVFNHRRSGTRRLVCEGTWLGGRRLPTLPEPPPAPWIV
ncbi:MAG: amidohydrolase/deacetylase family metallohydrolase [Thermoflexales bacterium]|nr:amidohydrolase/deacetylase family metallohydrolase [Thermoflexales bacterium]